MGFFNWMMRGLGFENDEEKSKVKTATKTVDQDDKYAEFNLHEKASTQDIKTDTLPSSTTFNQFGIQTTSDIVIIDPKTKSEIQQVIDFLKQGQSVAVNLEHIADEDRMRILDFLSGAIYGLNGSIHRWYGDLFLLAPEGHKILKPTNKE